MAPAGRSTQKPGPARKRGIWGCWFRLVAHVVRSPRAWKLVGLVKPWAVRRRTWRRLLVRFDSAAMQTTRPTHRRLDPHPQLLGRVHNHREYTNLAQMQPHPHDITSHRGPPGSLVLSITDSSRASTPTQGPSTTPHPTFTRRLNNPAKLNQSHESEPDVPASTRRPGYVTVIG